MIADPARRGRVLAELYRTLAPRLFQDLEGARVLPPGDEARRRAAEEWECFALYACVRGLIAAGGFNRETGIAIDAFHSTAVGDAAADEREAERRGRISTRYAEYGGVGLEGGKSGAASVTRRLGEAAARHIAGDAPASPELAELVGSLHESLAEGAAEAVRGAS